LRALSKTEKVHKGGGFYHDGRFATLEDVVEHYNRHLALALTDQEKSDLIEYLKSIWSGSDDIGCLAARVRRRSWQEIEKIAAARMMARPKQYLAEFFSRLR
jgi:cytochrome c peroxidase